MSRIIEVLSLWEDAFRVSRYRLEDKLDLIDVIDTVCSEGRWMHTSRLRLNEPWIHALTEMDCRQHLLLVPRRDGHPIGWCRAFPTSVPGEVDLGIGLLPPYRDKGLGTYLVQYTLRWAKKVGVRCVVLTTRLDNPRAIHVFKNCGFTEVDNCDNIWVEMTRVV